MDKDEFRRQMDAFNAEYRASLPGKLREVDELWKRMHADAARPEDSAELLRRLHTLAGSAKTFGFPELGTAARAAENYLEPYTRQGVMPPVAEREEFGRLLGMLRQCASV